MQSGWILVIKKYLNYYFLGCDNKTIQVYDSKSFDHLDSLAGHKDGVIHLEIADTMLYSGSYDHSIIAWDLKEMATRIREKKYMYIEDVISHKVEAYNKVMNKKKKKKKSKKKKNKKSSPKE